MASVQRETRNGKNRYRIWWRDGDKKRRSIRLAGVTQKEAAAIARRVQELNAARISGRAFDAALASWIADLGQDLSAKLAEAGLIEPQQRQSLGMFLRGYIEGRRQEVEQRTIDNLELTSRKLIDYLGDDRDLRSISPADACDFKQSLFGSVGSVTVAGDIKRARQFFAYAVKKGLIVKSPFAEVTAGSQDNPERKQFVPRDHITKVLEAAPNVEWRLLIALARYGGLRNPSETLRLKWDDILWDQNRIVVTSKKTKRYTPMRVIPLFPELKPFLDDAWEQAPDDATYCIERYRSQDVNMRTQLLRILKRAGVKPWPRLWHNLRGSRETELANQYPIHVAAEWIGNSPAIAAKHYLTVTDDHFNQAVADSRVVQGVVSQLAATASDDGSESQLVCMNPRQKQQNAVFIGVESDAQTRPVGFEPTTCGLEVRCSIQLSYGRKTQSYSLC